MDNRDEIIKNNIGLVHSCAKKFKGRGIEYDDLFQAGCLGLVKAVDAFDCERGVRFSTYAVPVILGEIKELSLKATRKVADFQSKKGREPTINELAELLEIEPAQAAQALEAAMVPMSLTVEYEDGQAQIDIPVESPDEKISEVLDLKQMVDNLENRDRAIILLRFFKNQTQTQTAKVLGMTQVQVSRREKLILRELKSKLSG